MRRFFLVLLLASPLGAQPRTPAEPLVPVARDQLRRDSTINEVWAPDSLFGPVLAKALRGTYIGGRLIALTPMDQTRHFITLQMPFVMGTTATVDVHRGTRYFDLVASMAAYRYTLAQVQGLWYIRKADTLGAPR